VIEISKISLEGMCLAMVCCELCGEGKMRRASFIIQFFVVFALVLPSFAQHGDYDKEFQKGLDDYQHHKYKDAEKHSRAALQVQPNSWQAHALLADALFGETNLECISEYEKARELADSSQATPAEKRHINDQLGIIYGMSGKFDQSIATYQKAIAQDPDYPIYYYNMACSYSEKGDLDQAISGLQEAFKRKDKWPSDQSLPDPRKDDSFKKYVGNEKFEAAVKAMGF
jgi:tetratricopeptide (TPR) repeat protein